MKRTHKTLKYIAITNECNLRSDELCKRSDKNDCRKIQQQLTQNKNKEQIYYSIEKPTHTHGKKNTHKREKVMQKSVRKIKILTSMLLRYFLIVIVNNNNKKNTKYENT